MLGDWLDDRRREVLAERRKQRRELQERHPELRRHAFRQRGWSAPERLLPLGIFSFVIAIALWVYVLNTFSTGSGGMVDWRTQHAWEALYHRNKDIWAEAPCVTEESRRLSVPATILYALGEWGRELQLQPVDRRQLVVHVIGATRSFEARSDWSVLLEFRPVACGLTVTCDQCTLDAQSRLYVVTVHSDCTVTTQ